MIRNSVHAHRVTAVIGCLAGLCCTAAQAQKPEATYMDVAYGDHERHVVDFWKAEGDQPTPVFIWVHCGGFRKGDKSSIPADLIKPCLAAGISCASIHYRYSSHAIYPAQMHDSARAIQFIRSKAKEWNIDPSRFAAGGGSAGSGISQWLAFHDDMAQPDSSDPIARQSTRLTCAIPVSMQCTYDPRQIKLTVPGNAYQSGALVHLFGLPPGTLWDDVDFDARLDALVKDASPINHLTRDDVPVYILHYERMNVPGNIHHANFGIHLQEKMDELGIECVRHLDSDFPSMKEAYTDIVEFLKKQLQRS